MMGFFVSALRQNDRGGWYPEINDVLGALGVPFSWVFSTMSGGSTNNLAVGLVDATQTQLDQIDAAANVWAMPMANWTTTTWQQAGAARRNKLNQLMSARGRDAAIQNSDTLEQAFRKMLLAMPERSVNSLEDLIVLWEQNVGPLPPP